MCGFCRSQRLYRRHAVKYTWIVDKCGIKRMRKREITQWLSIRCVDGGRTAGDVVSVNQQHEYEIHPIAVTPLWSRFASRLGTGFDAELMHFHMPLQDGRR